MTFSEVSFPLVTVPKRLNLWTTEESVDVWRVSAMSAFALQLLLASWSLLWQPPFWLSYSNLIGWSGLIVSGSRRFIKPGETEGMRILFGIHIHLTCSWLGGFCHFTPWSYRNFVGCKEKKYIFVLKHSSVSHCTIIPAMYESLLLPVTVIQLYISQLWF